MTSTEEGDLRGRLAEDWTLSPPRPRRSQSRLHNFSFSTLSWGRHKLLRCINIKGSVSGEAAGSAAAEVAQHDPGDGRKRPGSASSRGKSQPPRASPGGSGSKEADGRAMEEGKGEESSSSAAAAAAAAATAAAAAAAMRPWNLRTRRAACNAPAEKGRPRNPNSAAGSPSPLSAEKSKPVAKSVRLRSDDAGTGQWPTFSISLSRKEIEEDFMLFKGTKPPRKPKKRPKMVQEQLDSLLPGLWLSEITPNSYKIHASKRP